ncbi:NADH dehydrogenase subunit 4, partial [Operophtera brumata]
MYLTHLWLPKAHVEAPVSGSIILADIILKLGGLLGGFYIRLKSFCQVDIKSLIAHSSVAHIRIVIGGIIVINYWGFIGSYLLIIGHGLCPSGMFCLANINYELLNSRRLIINKGILNFIPSIRL